MGKGSTEAKIEFDHALAICFNADSVDSLEGEATAGPLAICVCRRDGADISTRVDHGAFSGITPSGIALLFSLKFILILYLDSH